MCQKEQKFKVFKSWRLINDKNSSFLILIFKSPFQKQKQKHKNPHLPLIQCLYFYSAYTYTVLTFNSPTYGAI